MRPLKPFLLELKDQIKQDIVPVSAAGIAFYGFFALFPALGALISIYGLVADPNEVPEQLNETLAGAPEGLRSFLVEEATDIASADQGALGVAVVVGILIALWSASAAIKHLIAALNRIYGFRETRGFVALRGASYLFTAGAIVVMAVAMFSLAVLPGLLAELDLGTFGRVLIGVLRFPGMVLFMAASLSVLYFLGPDRPGGYRFRWVTPGSLVATITWVLLSGLLSIYFANLDGGGSAELLVTLTMLMLFLQITSVCVLLGAEIDSTVELLQRREEASAEARVAASMTDRGRSAIVGAMVGAAAAVVTRRRSR